jgi:hypothetical protein
MTASGYGQTLLCVLGPALRMEVWGNSSRVQRRGTL